MTIGNIARFAVAVIVAGALTGASTPQEERENRLAWWREARFGMFIHWGLYAVPAGEWKGQPVSGIGEWIMNHARIPRAEYAQLARQFNPVKFNADEWVAAAKNAGMKYIVITSKHHDGFAMFASHASKYNIVDATPFHRDPLKELAAACRRQGMKLGFYYSQTQDWYEPDAVGNTWDFPDENKKSFNAYLERKVKPQVRELLMGYGPVALIWFDTPRNITKEQSQELADLVHSLQPDCLVSGRIGNQVGDYDSAGDNQISVGKVHRDWETPVTLNDTWGYKKDDQNWKSPAVLIRQLAQVTSRGGNYLLNVGPTAEGVIPAASLERLAEVGAWMRTNGESIYGTYASPFPYSFPWGVITVKPSRVFLHVFEWPQQPLVLYGIRNKIEAAWLLGDASRKPLHITQSSEKAFDHYELRIHLPEQTPDPRDSVIVLQTTDAPDVVTMLAQQPDGTVTLPAYLADVHGSRPGQALQFDSRGVVEHWTEAGESLEWEFQVARPQTFQLSIITSVQKYGKAWEGGHRVRITLAGHTVSRTVERSHDLDNPSNPYWPYVESDFGSVRIARPGTYRLELEPEAIEARQKLGLTLVSVRLQPSGK